MSIGTQAVLQDPSRLAALRSVAILDTPTEEYFDRLTRLATAVLAVPVALISLLDEDRQFFKSQCGLPEPWASRRETPLSHSFCQHVVNTGGPLVIDDAREHPLLRENLAIRDLNVIAYLGVPLRTSDGHVLGSFCVIDSQPQTWTSEDIDFVSDLAAIAMTELELRAQVVQREAAEAALRDSEARFRATFDDAPIGMVLVAPDGRFLRANRAFSEMLGYPDEELLRFRFSEVTHAEDLSANEDQLRRLLAGEVSRFRTDKRYLRRDGRAVPAVVHCSLVRDAAGQPQHVIAHVQTSAALGEGDTASSAT